MKNSENQFIKLPTKKSSENSDLIPEEEFVYIGLRAFMNGKTKQCNPSYKSLMAKIGIKGVDTLRKYLQSLESKGYIKIIDNGSRKSKNYEFIKDLPNYEKFKPEFIESTDLTFQQKSFLTAVQRLQYIDEESGFGKVSYQKPEIANLINTTSSIVHKRIKELENKGIVIVDKSNKIDIISGVKNEIYSFDLAKYNPIVEVLIKHELDIRDIIDVLTPEQRAEIQRRREQRMIII